MAAAGDAYERELKSLLCGEEKSLSKMCKTCNDQETAAYMSTMDEPFLVIRAAGSLGVDLVALRWDFSFPIEVKSSSEDVMHFSKNQRLSEQAEHMLDECTKSHLVAIYAFRLKGVRGDPWRLFTIPTDHEFRGKNRILYNRIPKLDVSSNGKFIMRWSDGMKLSEFIDYTRSEYQSE